MTPAVRTRVSGETEQPQQKWRQRTADQQQVGAHFQSTWLNLTLTDLRRTHGPGYMLTPAGFRCMTRHCYVQHKSATTFNCV